MAVVFTGIIQTTAQIVRSPGRGGGALIVRPLAAWDDLQRGESIAVNGACLTATTFDAATISFDVVPETARASNVGALAPGKRVNLERSLRAGDRFGGHYVLGHVDCLGRVRFLTATGGETELGVGFPPEFSRLAVAKGSIAVNGVSLTLGAVGEDHFSVYLIPYTLGDTNLGELRTGDEVNLEFDYFAKLALKARQAAAGGLGRALDRAGYTGEDAWNE